MSPPINEHHAVLDMRAHAIRHYQAAAKARWFASAISHRFMGLWHDEIANRLTRRNTGPRRSDLRGADLYPEGRHQPRERSGPGAWSSLEPAGQGHYRQHARFSSPLSLSLTKNPSQAYRPDIPAAATAAAQLEQARVLVERTGYARNRVFAAHEALSVLNRPFGEDPILPER